ncbi:MAG: hypothetical protein IKW00_04255 [Clostridia bacterium]|nr:hypothetical protein [Clostridia bacterium]
MDALSCVLSAREILKNITPLKTDCGKYCGAACCDCDEDGQGGMVLFPGEEKLYEALPEGMELSPYDAILPGMKLLVCDGVCSRDERPLSCMLFPLTPVVTETEGKDALKVIVDPRAFSVCPLSESGVRGMDAEFVRAVREAGKVLCKNPQIRAYLKALNVYFERLRSWS